MMNVKEKFLATVPDPRDRVSCAFRWQQDGRTFSLELDQISLCGAVGVGKSTLMKRIFASHSLNDATTDVIISSGNAKCWVDEKYNQIIILIMQHDDTKYCISHQPLLRKNINQLFGGSQIMNQIPYQDHDDGFDQWVLNDNQLAIGSLNYMRYDVILDVTNMWHAALCQIKTKGDWKVRLINVQERDARDHLLFAEQKQKTNVNAVLNYVEMLYLFEKKFYHGLLRSLAWTIETFPDNILMSINRYRFDVQNLSFQVFDDTVQKIAERSRSLEQRLIKEFIMTDMDRSQLRSYIGQSFHLGRLFDLDVEYPWLFSQCGDPYFFMCLGLLFNHYAQGLFEQGKKTRYSSFMLTSWIRLVAESDKWALLDWKNMERFLTHFISFQNVEDVFSWRMFIKQFYKPVDLEKSVIGMLCILEWVGCWECQCLRNIITPELKLVRKLITCNLFNQDKVRAQTDYGNVLVSPRKCTCSKITIGEPTWNSVLFGWTGQHKVKITSVGGLEDKAFIKSCVLEFCINSNFVLGDLTHDNFAQLVADHFLQREKNAEVWIQSEQSDI